MDLNHAPLITLKEPCRASRSLPAIDLSHHRSQGRVKNEGWQRRPLCFVVVLEEVDLVVQHRNSLNHSSY